VRDLRRSGNFEPVGLLDDAPHLRGAKLQGLPILGTWMTRRRWSARPLPSCWSSPCRRWTPQACSGRRDLRKHRRAVPHRAQAQ
jgi:hypothetical protein